MPKCECDEVGILYDWLEFMYDPKTELPYVNHEPNNCKCTNDLKYYQRGNKKLWLCSCCQLKGDKEIK